MSVDVCVNGCVICTDAAFWESGDCNELMLCVFFHLRLRFD